MKPIEILPMLLRIAGGGLILLAITHIPISRRLKWKEQRALMSAENASVFHVHMIFICVILVMMGLPSLVEPEIFIEKSRAALWASWSICGFWVLRLYCQWFVYGAELWRGKRLETSIHLLFTGIWSALSLVYGASGAVQSGWLP